jgi:hypothetical protein
VHDPADGHDNEVSVSPACSVEALQVLPDSDSSNDPALDVPTARQDVAEKHWIPLAVADVAPAGRAACEAVHFVPDNVSTRTWLVPPKRNVPTATHDVLDTHEIDERTPWIPPDGSSPDVTGVHVVPFNVSISGSTPRSACVWLPTAMHEVSDAHHTPLGVGLVTPDWTMSLSVHVFPSSTAASPTVWTPDLLVPTATHAVTDLHEMAFSPANAPDEVDVSVCMTNDGLGGTAAAGPERVRARRRTPNSEERAILRMVTPPFRPVAGPFRPLTLPDAADAAASVCRLRGRRG